MDNTVTICGSLGQDPDLKFTSSGQATVSMSVAVSKRWQDKTTNEWKEQTSWIRVIAWRELAENCAESLQKGSRVVATGRLEQRSWEKDGQKQSVVELVADDIGASMRRASVAITRNERRDSGTPVPNSPPDAPAPAAPYGGTDEEPFVLAAHIDTAPTSAPRRWWTAN